MLEESSNISENILVAGRIKFNYRDFSIPSYKSPPKRSNALMALAELRAIISALLEPLDLKLEELEKMKNDIFTNCILYNGKIKLSFPKKIRRQLKLARVYTIELQPGRPTEFYIKEFINS